MKKYSLNALLILGGFFVVAIAHYELIDLYIQTVIMLMGINIILSTSLNLVNGYMGEFSCGHAGFMCVGAYVSSVISVLFFAKDRVFGAPLLDPALSVWLFPVVIGIGGLAAAFAGLLVALPSFRTRGDYLAIITIAANYMIISAIENMDSIGGPRGFQGMKRVINNMYDVSEIPWMMIWIMLGTFFSVWLLRRFVSSTYGKGVIAVCQDEVAAEIMSVNTNRMKLAAFMVSSGLAGVAGGLFAHVYGYVNPQSFNILKSTECLVMVYLGGMGSLSGSVLSAILFTLLIEALRFIIPEINMFAHYVGIVPDSYEIGQVWKWVIIPMVLILLMQFRPEGILGNRELSDVFPRLRKLYTFR
ncbi:branched-chain amino acid ABC transporter permease [Desulfobaculum bizertense]|uniref:Amino acid/amide ABC transporter membrane protein 2, HAAT family n=1 Tax=Desulfobaculum bizertense DSM 18034 TaxID=1121442 RepID=A0A1T4X2H7_9BACT|nr:branched-chain amino acid ABC transporter permease [Desulfobaculum bizertense]SKA83285.1 amino acid/amide ABC transporter membrane protein 2, HAAT family [Desulfobaculum bizertense DSM 18034]